MSIQLESTEDKASAVGGDPPRRHYYGLYIVRGTAGQEVRFCLETSPLLSAHPISESKETKENGEFTQQGCFPGGEIF